jgi:hypothetical protein
MQGIHFLLPASLLTLLALLTALTASDARATSYFSTHGAFNNSCKVRECSTCGTGQYRLGCANASLGTCANCTKIPNATLTSHGWFNNSCNFTCNEGFVASGSSCRQVIVIYSVSFPTSITLLNSTNQIFNLTTFINAVAGLAGCGVCGNVSRNPTTCGLCTVLYSYNASIPAVFRRLLSSGSVVKVDTTISVNDKAQATAAVSNINSEALNTRLSQLGNSNAGTASVTKAPTLTTQTTVIAPPPVNPPVNPPTPPPIIPGTPDSASNTGAIAGGVVGGVVGLILIGVLVWYFTGNKKEPTVKSTKSLFTYRQGKRGGKINHKLSTQFVYVRKT